MTTDEINKELVLADVVLSVIDVEDPMLLYGKEKEVVKKALHEYKYKLYCELGRR